MVNKTKGDKVMGQFFGVLDGTGKYPVGRQGTEKTGLKATVNGWNTGIRIEARVDEGRDKFDIYLTHGSETKSIGTHGCQESPRDIYLCTVADDNMIYFDDHQTVINYGYVERILQEKVMRGVVR